MGNKKNNLPPVSVTLSNRAKWLWNFAKLRNYTFDSNDSRNTFLYVYFLTWMQAYNNYNFAYAITHRRNRQLDKPLKPTDIDKKIRLWNQPKYTRNFTNEALIRLLKITPEEVDVLKIGYNKKLKAERAQRTVLRNERNREISLLRAKGLTQKEIAEKLNISLSTVKRILREARIFLEGSEFTINRSNTAKGMPTKEFVSPDAERLYSLYRTEKESALCVEEETLVMSKLRNSESNLIIQGPAGSGKSALLKKYLDSLSREERSKVLLTAPTGKAADIIGGTTIHKAFEFPNSVQMLDEEITCIPKMLHGISTIVIDEFSMIRVDVFTKIMQILQFAKSQGQEIRLIALGDFAQLKPVVTSADIEIMKMLYPDLKGYYAFHSPLWRNAHFEKINIHNVMRQKNVEFIESLQGIRFGRLADLRWIQDNASPFISANPIYICSKRKTVDNFNRSALEEFGKEKHSITYQAEYNGTLLEELPCPELLTIATGVRVICCCNDKYYKNGMIGTVKSFDDYKIIVAFDNGKSATIKKKTFILENGTQYKQFPLTLGYAITAHKAQGSTFSNVAIVCDGFFEAGQLYCALSRCPSLDNMTFIGELKSSDLKVDIEALKMTVCG